MTTKQGYQTKHNFYWVSENLNLQLAPEIFEIYTIIITTTWNAIVKILIPHMFYDLLFGDRI